MQELALGLVGLLQGCLAAGEGLHLLAQPAPPPRSTAQARQQSITSSWYVSCVLCVSCGDVPLAFFELGRESLRHEAVRAALLVLVGLGRGLGSARRRGQEVVHHLARAKVAAVLNLLVVVRLLVDQVLELQVEVVERRLGPLRQLLPLLHLKVGLPVGLPQSQQQQRPCRPTGTCTHRLRQATPAPACRVSFELVVPLSLSLS